MSNAWAIGLYSYSISGPGNLRLDNFVGVVLSIFESIGIAPTYFGAIGPGYDGDLKRYGGRIHTKASKEGFSGLHAVTLVANPVGSDAPAYDSFASASLSYVAETNASLLCLAMEERLHAFGNDAFERILSSLVSLNSWEFGYVLSQPTEKKPEFHILGLSGGSFNPHERQRLNAWYASEAHERLHKIRDVYPYLVLNRMQLSYGVSANQTLQEYICSKPGGSLRQIDESLWLWTVQPNAVADIRSDLLKCGALISRD